MSGSATAQQRNKRKSFSRPHVSRSLRANSFNRYQILSAVAGTRATILQPPSTTDGGPAMTARLPSIIARTHRRSRGLHQSSHSLRRPLPELHQPLHEFIQPLRGLHQSLPDANQSLNEARQPLQDALNQTFGLNRLKSSSFHQKSNSTQRRKEAKTPSQAFLCAFVPLR